MGRWAMSTPAGYDTGLTDEKWDLLDSLLPERKWRLGGPGDHRSTCDKSLMPSSARSTSRNRHILLLFQSLVPISTLAMRPCLSSR